MKAHPELEHGPEWSLGQKQKALQQHKVSDRCAKDELARGAWLHH